MQAATYQTSEPIWLYSHNAVNSQIAWLKPSSAPAHPYLKCLKFLFAKDFRPSFQTTLLHPLSSRFESQIPNLQAHQVHTLPILLQHDFFCPALYWHPASYLNLLATSLYFRWFQACLRTEWTAAADRLRLYRLGAAGD